MLLDLPCSQCLVVEGLGRKLLLNVKALSTEPSPKGQGKGVLET